MKELMLEAIKKRRMSPEKMDMLKQLMGEMEPIENEEKLEIEVEPKEDEEKAIAKELQPEPEDENEESPIAGMTQTEIEIMKNKKPQGLMDRAKQAFIKKMK